MSNPFLIPKNEIHLWYFSIHSIDIQKKQFSSILDLEEHAKAKRFYFSQDRKRFIASRGILRKLLGGYLNIDPINVQFSLNTFGKPQVVCSHFQKTDSVFFNLSHSGNFFCIAVSKNTQLGIDLEIIDPDRSIEKIVEKYFSLEEKKYLLQINEEERLKRFYKIWTCKEAFIKGIGEGLHFPLKNLQFLIQQNSFSIQLKQTKNLENFSSWSVRLLDCPIENAVSALAVESPLDLLKYRQWINPSFL